MCLLSVGAPSLLYFEAMLYCFSSPVSPPPHFCLAPALNLNQPSPSLSPLSVDTVYFLCWYLFLHCLCLFLTLSLTFPPFFLFSTFHVITVNRPDHHWADQSSADFYAALTVYCVQPGSDLARNIDFIKWIFQKPFFSPPTNSRWEMVKGEFENMLMLFSKAQDLAQYFSIRMVPHWPEASPKKHSWQEPQ